MNQDKSVVLDEEFGINQLSGNRDLLLKMLQRFKDDHGDCGAAFEEAAAQQDFTELKKRAHTTKGVAGNLGLWALHHSSKVLEDAAKAETPSIKAEIEPFVQCLQDTLDAITALQEGGSAPEPQASPAQDNMAELRNALEQNEFVMPDTLSQWLANSGFDAGVQEAITDAINDLDYPQALALIDAQ